MKIPILFLLFVLISFTASADQLDGLDGLGIVFMCVIVGSISFLFLIFGSIMRFTKHAEKPNQVLTISGVVLILSCLVAMNTIGNGIDPGFLSACLGLIILSLGLILLNLSLIKRKN